MPGIDGYETCYRTLKGLGTPASDIPIIFITANDTVQSRQKGYQAGGSEYMAKPFLRGELKLAIRRALRTLDSLRGHTVLVVDDSSAILGLLKVGLGAKGLKVIKA